MALYLGNQKVTPIIREGANLTTKTITENGTYNASSDNADGYSSVTVNVPTSGLGIPREVSVGGEYEMPTTSFKFALPSNATKLGSRVLQCALQYSSGLTEVDLSSLTTINHNNAMDMAFCSCNSLTKADLSNLTTISGDKALHYAFEGCASLTDVDLSSLITLNGSDVMNSAFSECPSLVNIDLSNLTTVSGSSAMVYAFLSDTSLIEVDLSSLTTVSGDRPLQYVFSHCENLTDVDLSSLANINSRLALNNAFSYCTSLTSLSFPSLNSNSFGSYTNQFNNMLQDVTGCTVHFPSNLQSVIGSWSDVQNGFGGTNTTVLFDLTATT